MSEHETEHDANGVEDGDRIAPAAIGDALTRAPLAYTDGSVQIFSGDGRTRFTENGTSTRGDWGVDEHGSFWSFWPPSYRAVYDVYWIVEDGHPVGVRFVDRGRGSVSEGRYPGL